MSLRRCSIAALNAAFLSFNPISARDLPGQIEETINVGDYAKCDGTSDVASQIKAAAAKAMQRKPLYFPPMPSECLLSDSFTVASGTTVYAQPGSVVLKMASGNTTGLFYTSNASDVVVSGLTFDGGGEDFASSVNVTTTFRGSNITFERSVWRNTRGIAVQISESSHSGVRDSAFRNIGNHWKITNVASDRHQALSITSGDPGKNVGNFASNNTFYDVGLDDINLGDQAAINVVYNKCAHDATHYPMAFEDRPACIYLNNVDGASIIGNTSLNAYGNGIDIVQSKKIAVANNRIMGPGFSGVGIFSSSGKIKGNIILNGNQNKVKDDANCRGGICFGGKVFDTNISNNISTDYQSIKTQEYGVYAVPGTTLDNVIIEKSNDFEGNRISKYGGNIFNKNDGK